MKWSPQPKTCGRWDCREPQRQWGFCETHGRLFRRNGKPYRQDELFEMDQRNAYERDMDEALEADPPQIVWRKDNHGILRAVSVSDRHAEGTTAAQARRLRAAAEIAEREEAARQAEITRLQVLELMQAEADEVAERFRKHRADNTPLMSAARREI